MSARYKVIAKRFPESVKLYSLDSIRHQIIYHEYPDGKAAAAAAAQKHGISLPPPSPSSKASKGGEKPGSNAGSRNASPAQRRKGGAAAAVLEAEEPAVGAAAGGQGHHRSASASFPSASSRRSPQPQRVFSATVHPAAANPGEGSGCFGCGAPKNSSLLMLPCQHSPFCTPCAKRARGRACPQCLKNIEDMVELID